MPASVIPGRTRYTDLHLFLVVYSQLLRHSTPVSSAFIFNQRCSHILSQAVTLMPMGLYVRLVVVTVSRQSFDILLYHILNQQAPKCGIVSGPHYDAFRANWHSSGSGRTYLTMSSDPISVVWTWSPYWYFIVPYLTVQHWLHYITFIHPTAVL